MNILHITDIHFGPYHWNADDNLLIARLNSFDADIVFNTGDMTSDSFPEEFSACADFIAKIKCPNIVTIPGNHDKYSKQSHELFREFFYNGEFIQPKDPSLLKKTKVFIDQTSVQLNEYFTEMNFLRMFEIDGEKLLVICIDTNVFQQDPGEMEVQILESLRDEIPKLSYDRALLLSHHSILSTDNDPVLNSKRITDFVLEMGIEATFCGHTHEFDIVEVSDLVRRAKYRQFMCGSLSSVNISREKNMFCTYENFGTADEIITVTRIIPGPEGIEFIQTEIPKWDQSAI